MFGIRAVLCGIVLGVCALAASPDYFPLHPGNEWVYRCSGLCGEPLHVTRVSRAEYIGGRWYSVFEGFGVREAFLRQDDGGTVWALDRATGQEIRWYSFSTPVGQSYDTSIDPCSRRATVFSRNNRYEGPAGVFPETLQITYPPGPCMDAGLTEEIFYRWTGLMRRTETTIGGPRTYNLLYARTAGATVISQPELHFSLTVDKTLYTPSNTTPLPPLPVPPGGTTPVPFRDVTARLTLRNTTDKPVTLDFASGQRYDLEVRHETAGVVYRWSDGKAFPAVMGQETIGPGEKNYVIVFQLTTKDDRFLQVGQYTVEAWLTNSGPQRFRASVGFEVPYVY